MIFDQRRSSSVLVAAAAVGFLNLELRGGREAESLRGDAAFFVCSRPRRDGCLFVAIRSAHVGDRVAVAFEWNQRLRGKAAHDDQIASSFSSRFQPFRR